jgi:hypothetical protein
LSIIKNVTLKKGAKAKIEPRINNRKGIIITLKEKEAANEYDSGDYRGDMQEKNRSHFHFVYKRNRQECCKQIAR